MNIALLRMPTRENKVNTCTGLNSGSANKVQVCFLCQAPASEQCSQCKLVYYCSKAHYNLHRVTIQEVSDALVPNYTNRWLFSTKWYHQVYYCSKTNYNLHRITLRQEVNEMPFSPHVSTHVVFVYRMSQGKMGKVN